MDFSSIESLLSDTNKNENSSRINQNESNLALDQQIQELLCSSISSTSQQPPLALASMATKDLSQDQLINNIMTSIQTYNHAKLEEERKRRESEESARLLSLLLDVFVKNQNSNENIQNTIITTHLPTSPANLQVPSTQSSSSPSFHHCPICPKRFSKNSSLH